jgi:hypothetical protein
MSYSCSVCGFRGDSDAYIPHDCYWHLRDKPTGGPMTEDATPPKLDVPIDALRDAVGLVASERNRWEHMNQQTFQHWESVWVILSGFLLASEVKNDLMTEDATTQQLELCRCGHDRQLHRGACQLALCDCDEFMKAEDATTPPTRQDLIEKLSDTMDPDNAAAFVQAVITEECRALAAERDHWKKTAHSEVDRIVRISAFISDERNRLQDENYLLQQERDRLQKDRDEWQALAVKYRDQIDRQQVK